MKIRERILSIVLCLVLLPLHTVALNGDGKKETVSSGMKEQTEAIDADTSGTGQPFEVDAAGAILMEVESGRVLAEWNADARLPPASVTKIMTLLLTMEALDGGKFSLTDTVQISKYAASMGGSQVFLKEGESITVEELIKSVVIASANDAAVALAELVSGDCDSFVARMNERARELGMENSHFENPTGLDDDVTDHVYSPRDVAISSRELIRSHPLILTYSGIWMDSIRDGAFGLTNTNRLVRFYRGATGLKTGSTAKARFCISATAMRNGMHLIAVVMGSPTRDVRNETAKKILDWGFAHYEIYTAEAGQTAPIPLLGGREKQIVGADDGISILLDKGKGSAVEPIVELPEELAAPIEAGQVIGRIRYVLDGKELGQSEIRCEAGAERLGYDDLLRGLLRFFFLCGETEAKTEGVEDEIPPELTEKEEITTAP